jgi:hypothetical protein
MKNKTFYILSALLAAGFIGYIIYIRMKDKKKGEEASSATFPISSDDSNSGSATPVNTDRPEPTTNTTQTTAGTTETYTPPTADTTTAAGTTTSAAGTTTATAGTAATYTPPTPTGTGSSVIRTWQMNPTRITVNTNRV